MSHTLAEKILLAHTDIDEVAPGDIVMVRCDVVMTNDISCPMAFRAMEKMGATKVFDASKVVVVPDHFIPAKDTRSAELQKLIPDTEKLIALANRLPAMLKGEDKPKGPTESLAIAQLCYNQTNYSAAVRLWADAIATDPKLADDRRVVDAERPKQAPGVERHIVERVRNRRLRRTSEADLVWHDHAESFARENVDRPRPRLAEEVEPMEQYNGLTVRRSRRRIGAQW